MRCEPAWRSITGASSRERSASAGARKTLPATTRLTSVRLSASTTFEASSLTGASGSLVRLGELTVAHSLTNEVAVSVSGGAAYRSYQGIDLNELTYTGSATATYAITDMTDLQAEYSYEHFDSSRAGQDYDSHTIEAGVRFRR
ncbi:MAG: outer membrane beta-barrel protein [Breoghania sp.]|nr:outer membrane beta-barrel protein [Breoghania sp.]MDJ0932474.1 outer membrane beta-barrel protein [Breoghania sp.]